MAAPDSMRLDKWLWFTRLASTRSAAQKLCESRKLRLNSRIVEKSGTLVRIGHIIAYPKGDHVIAVQVDGLPTRRQGPTEAKNTYFALLAAPNPHLENHPGWAGKTQPTGNSDVDGS